MTPRIALYTRISALGKDVDKVENQRLRLINYASAKSYKVAETFVDDGIGAYKPDTPRPGFEGLIAGIKDGRFDIVLATEQQRFGRNVTEWETFINLLQAHNVMYECISGGGPWDMNQAMHKRLARTQVVDAAGEVDTRKERQAGRISDEVTAGNPLWGGRAFGYNWEKGRAVSLNKVEADLIRGAGQDVLSGVSLYSISSRWNDQGVKTSRGGDWTPATLRKMLLRPMNAGWVTYKGELLAQTYISTLETEVWEAIVELLEDPSRKPKRGPRAGSLLSGVLRCRCGAPMTSENGRGLYKCSKQRRGTGPHQSVDMEIADAVVEDVAVEALIKGDLDEPQDLGKLTAINDALKENQRQIDSVTDVLMDPDVRDKKKPKQRLLVLQAAREKLQQQRTDFTTERVLGGAFEEFRAYLLDENTDDPLAETAVYDTISNGWTDLPIERRRDIVKSKFTVTVTDGKGPDRVLVVPVG